MRRSPLKRIPRNPLTEWHNAVLLRDGNRCQLTQRDRCSGPLAAHHVVFRSRDVSRSHDVDNGATLCRRHHDWVHANSAEARSRFGLAGHAEDQVLNGRVVPEGLIIIDDPVPARPADTQQLVAALVAARPKRSA